MSESGKVTYAITVDREMFPFAPGSEVVWCNYNGEPWKQGLYLHAETGMHKIFSHDCSGYCHECHPLTTHGHLLDTTYPADTPACAKCGKAAPRSANGGCYKIEGAEVCEECFEEAIKDKPTATTADVAMEQLAAVTAERDALRAELEAMKTKPTSPAHPGEFQPFQRVLVVGEIREWAADFFSHIDNQGLYVTTSLLNVRRSRILPYDGNEHLLGTIYAPE